MHRVCLLLALFLAACEDTDRASDSAWQSTIWVSTGTGSTTTTGSGTTPSTGSSGQSTSSASTVSTGTTTASTSTTTTVPVCTQAAATPGFLDQFQVPNDGMVSYCHDSAGQLTYVQTSVGTCMTHVGHVADIYPTTICTD